MVSRVAAIGAQGKAVGEGPVYPRYPRDSAKLFAGGANGGALGLFVFFD
jgi:hypothetical protein